MLLPDGVLFKKLIVALVIELNIRKCKFIDALVHTDTSITDLNKAIMIIKNVSPAKTKIHDCLDAVHNVKNPSDKTVADVLIDVEDSARYSIVRKTFFSK
jgi:hypothetical protein